jgi:hypothetical protein
VAVCLTVAVAVTLERERERMVGSKVKLKVKMMVSQLFPINAHSSGLAPSGEHRWPTQH